MKTLALIAQKGGVGKRPWQSISPLLLLDGLSSSTSISRRVLWCGRTGARASCPMWSF